MDDTRGPFEVLWRGGRSGIVAAGFAAAAAWGAFGFAIVLRRTWLPVGDGVVWLAFVGFGILLPIAVWNRRARVMVDDTRLLVWPQFGRRTEWPLDRIAKVDLRSPTELRVLGPAGRKLRLRGREVGQIAEACSQRRSAVHDRP